MPENAHDVYAQQLFKLALGYPLWEPEPKNARGQGEVLIGDVGYLGQGGFYRFFNAMREAEDSIHIAVPPNFKKFQLGMIPIITANNVINEGPLFSQTVRRLEVGGGAGSHGVNVAFQCECTDQQGALAILDTPGKRELVQQTRRMAKYMKENIDTWHRWANSDEVGYSVAIEDILFVRGWVKTSRWAVAAFFGNTGRHAKLTFNGDLGLPVSAAFRIETQRETAATCLPRIGPDNRPRLNPNRPLGPAQPEEPPSLTQAQNQRSKKKKGKGRADDMDQRRSREMDAGPSSGPWGNQAQEQYPSDQCMFLHYFKLKKRPPLPSLKTATGVKPQDDESEDIEIESGGDLRQWPYDPVIFILNYIFEHSEAAVAVASDIDLIRVCKNRCQYPIPDDIPRFLEDSSPEIEVTEDGLGMLRFDDVQVMDLRLPENANIHVEGPHNDAQAPGSPHAVHLPNHSGTCILLPPLACAERCGGISALAYSPVGREIAAGCENNTIVVWTAMNRSVRFQFEEHSGNVSALVFSPDGSKLVSGGRDGRVIIWDLIDGGSIRSLNAHQGTVERVAYSADGKLIASGADSVVKLWEAETGNLRGTTEEHGGIIMYVVFAPDNERFVSTSSDGSARVWSTHTAAHVCDLKGHEGVIYTIAYSPDRKRLVTRADDGTTRIWSALIGDEFARLREGEDGSVCAAAFSADGKELHSVGSERVIKTYDSFTAELLNTIDGGNKVVTSPAFSADGRLFAAGGEDHTITVWDMSTKQEVAHWQLPGLTDNVNHLSFSHDNRHIASASDDGMVREWELPALSETDQPMCALDI
ncbi:WD40-repeat-containing domain protein [Fomitopsis serialis]|uniref:WD40-repeat-containing domain protein n=1 Tax=Fomitopsis serialis TaxID=139415 RepID=UPI00200806DF|nr:WD40-repeat-containing domain protein [Neoantrodia serialis]KAH9919631.1 WD40-repeat-containing domain protein [Neoantrodia serialis]